MVHDAFYTKIVHWVWGMFATLVVIFLLVGTLLWYMYQVPYSPPGITQLNTYVEIPSGSSASSVGALLESKGVIRSGLVFKTSIQTSGLAHKIKSGTYYFNTPQSLDDVIVRVTTSDYGLPTTSITLFEGEPNFKYATRLADKFEYVDEQEFIREARDLEGYLFPDTYNISLRATTDEIIKQLNDNFKKRIEPLEQEIADSQYSLEEIITMASLVETEAGSASYETKQRVAGVLWKRISIDMPLQADAVFSYIYQEHLPRVLFRHLEVDSPYNVYKHNGLPPGPIANPGIDSIRATLNPVITENLFYITGNDGKFYYAKTLGGHNQNIRNHLRY